MKSKGYLVALLNSCVNAFSFHFLYFFNASNEINSRSLH